MAKFLCNSCGKEQTIAEYSVKIVDNKMVIPEAKCCDTYMERVRDFGGWGSIRKGPGGQVLRKPRAWE